MSNVQTESLEANVKVDRAHLVEQVLTFASACQSRGIIADEVVGHYGEGALHNNYAPRITELWIAGELVRTQRRRKTRSDNNARVHVFPTFATEEERVYSADALAKRKA